MSDQRARIDTLEQAAAWLEGLINVERTPDLPYRRLGLDPIRALLARVDHPERTAPIIHVAGSKGKGSTCLFAEALLGALGWRVGTFTSPHLVSWTERFRVAGHDIEGAVLARAVERVRPEVEALRVDPAVAPTFFDATTAAALVAFEWAKVDAIVLEVGLGGRLDSTNAVSPAVTAITSIELEHTDRLGHTLAAIAGEKAGILKPGVPCIVGALPEEALEVVHRRAREVGAPLLVHATDWTVETAPAAASGAHPARAASLRLSSGATLAFELGPAGRHQSINAGIALLAVREMLRSSADSPTDGALAEAAQAAWRSLGLPGRLELVADDPPCWIDAAHTRASARELAFHLDSLAPKGIVFVLSVSADKDVDAVLSPLLERARLVVTTRSEPIRSLPAEELARRIAARAPGLAVEVVPEVAAACARAREAAGEGEIVCAAGSVYLAGAARVAFTRLAGREAPGGSGAA